MIHRDFNDHLVKLFDKHIAHGFVDRHFLDNIKKLILKKELFGRRELLFLLHSIGATYDEANEVLKSAGYEELYVKRREDAVWAYVLFNSIDGKTIIDTIFPQ